MVRFRKIICLVGLFAISIPAYADIGVTQGDVDWRPTDGTLYCLQGDMVHLKGHFTGERGLDTAILQVDRANKAQMAASGTFEDDYNFVYAAQAPGPHSLRVVYMMSNGVRVIAQTIPVYVLASTPAVLKFEAPTPFTDIGLTISPDPGAPFHFSRAQMFFDTKPCGPMAPAGASAALPVSTYGTGQYSASVDLYDAGGNRCHLSLGDVSIPERISVNFPPQVLCGKVSDTFAITPVLPNTFKPARVTYYVARMPSRSPGQQGSSVQGTEVDAVDTAPFSAKLNLSQYPSGSYVVYAGATDINGMQFIGPSAQFSFTNGPKDADAAREAKAEADRESAIAVAQAQAAQAQAEADQMRQNRGPLGKAKTIIEKFLAAHHPTWSVDRVVDVKKSDSIAFPESVDALINLPPDTRELSSRIQFQIDPLTEEVSDYVKNW